MRPMGDWLLVDVGNSRLKWGRAVAGRLVVGESFPSAAEGLAERLDRRWTGLPKPGAVYVSQVAGPGVAVVLGAWVAARWGVPARFIRGEPERCGVINGYQRPEQLGADRWAGLIGLCRHYPLPACLVDCGTALTVDLLDGGGRHLGGWIAPGLALMRRALARDTAGVGAPAGGGGAPPGRNTADGVAGGVLWAAAGLVEKIAAGAGPALAPGLVLTGGDGEAVGRCLALPYRIDPDLVLKGLLTIAESEA